MLNKNEKIVMQIIYDKMSDSQKAVIITEDEIWSKLPKMAKIDLDDLREILQQLAIDEYFELIHTEKKGNPVMVITLKKKGIAFERSLVQQKRKLGQKIVITVICAVITALISLFIKNLGG
ncbi:MAG: hypothetical protein IKA42_03115 [Clostridia bacterium]|nr:hypothetical protein [Clostridia bacterium]